MSLIFEGKIVGFLTITYVMIVAWYFMYNAEKGKSYHIRRLRQVDAIDEIVARCVEMDSELLFIPGGGDLNSTGSIPAALSVLGILSYVAAKAAEYGAKIHLPTIQFVSYNIQAEILRDAYIAAGKPELFVEGDTIRYLPSGTDRPYILNRISRLKPAGSIFVGAIWHQAVIYSDALQQVGSLTLGGTDSSGAIPYLVASCQYSLISEEMYAISAYLSKDPILTSSLVGQDMAKYLVIILSIVGSLLAILGMPIVDLFAV